MVVTENYEHKSNVHLADFSILGLFRAELLQTKGVKTWKFDEGSVSQTACQCTSMEQPGLMIHVQSNNINFDLG